MECCKKKAMAISETFLLSVYIYIYVLCVQDQKSLYIYIYIYVFKIQEKKLMYLNSKIQGSGPLELGFANRRPVGGSRSGLEEGAAVSWANSKTQK